MYASLVIFIALHFITVTPYASCDSSTKPNIIMIVADDLGWNDVSFHGSAQIPTPNIDMLANNGVILNSYYVTPICSPSRSAIMTGKYPIHTGMQTSTVFAPNAWGVDPKEILLPQYLKAQGYKTHAVGKWHLGMCAEEYLPNRRGFDSFYGYYLGKGDYWDHSNVETYWGLDLHDNGKPVRNQWGNYSTELYTAIGMDRICNHNKSEPLFLYLAYQAVHSANRRNHDPIQATDYWLKKFSHIKNEGRRKFAAVTASLDEGVGKIFKAVEDAGILDNTIIVFTTDNGGPPNGFDFNYASNFPLRGTKAHLWEGGVRGVAAVYSKLIKNPGRVSDDLLHITDWLPTFLELAGGNSSKIHKLDGFNIWDTISSQKASPRTEILLNIDPILYKNAAVRVGDYKLIEGESGYWSGWFPPPESEEDSIERQEKIPFLKDAVVSCGKKPTNVTRDCSTKHGPCLFNIRDDPCEYTDISKEQPDITKALLLRLATYKESMIKPRNNFTDDPLSNPKIHGGSWEPWL
eukprot:gene3645-4162_t